MATGLRAILRDLERHKHIFDFDRDGLGDDLMDVAADVILRLMDDECDHNGVAWAPLSQDYAAWKSEHFPGNPIAVLYGIMKTEEQVKGERFVSTHECRMVYGITSEAKDTASGFQEGDPSNNKPARPFYKLGSEHVARLDDFCRKHLAKNVK